jgi:translation elongation factor EF-Ts
MNNIVEKEILDNAYQACKMLLDNNDGDIDKAKQELRRYGIENNTSNWVVEGF